MFRWLGGFGSGEWSLWITLRSHHLVPSLTPRILVCVYWGQNSEYLWILWREPIWADSTHAWGWQKPINRSERFHYLVTAHAAVRDDSRHGDRTRAFGTWAITFQHFTIWFNWRLCRLEPDFPISEFLLILCRVDNSYDVPPPKRYILNLCR